MIVTLRILYLSDIYEVEIRPCTGGHIVHRVIKYMGDSQYMREVEFQNLPKDLITKIEKEFHAKKTKLSGL